MKIIIKAACLVFAFAIAASEKTIAQNHANDNLWYNDGAALYIGTNTLVTVQGDVTNNQAGITGITHLENNGFMWVQGNMYGDNAFKQTGTGVLRLQNKTSLYTAPYATENYQVIQGGYRVNGGKDSIGATGDGSFYDLELDNQNGLVFIKGNTDVRNSVDFKPASVTVDGNIIAPNGTINRLLTYAPGTTNTPAAAPVNGTNYTATFGMMNSASGLSNFKNLSTNLTTNTAVLDSAYVQGKLRRALDATSGGSYGFPLGLEPSTSTTAARGIQYAKLDFTANTYDVIAGYFQQGSDNTDTSRTSSCGITGDFKYYGTSNHGEWIFTPLTAANSPYDLTIYPQDYGTVSSPKYFITRDNNVPMPGNQSCAASPLGLSVTGVTGFPVSEFGFAGGTNVTHNPDINITYVNVPVPGDVSTNDKQTPGSTYGNPPANPNNPSSCMPVMNVDGSGKYTFVCDVPGIFVFNVPVCEPGGSPCTPVPLTITVLDSKDDKTAPIANPDYGTTKKNTPITIPVVENDKCQNGPTCTLSTPTVVVPPSHGVFNPNDNTYTPTTGFVGNDTLQYAVCDNQVPSKCDTTFVYIKVIPDNAPNSTTAVDDYAQTPFNTPVSGNAKTNDTDPERDLQNVTPQTTTAPGKGTLELHADGTFTFTPVPGFSGPVSFPYTTCDTVSAPNTACANATIHILVEPKEPVHHPDINVTYVNTPVPGDVSTNDKQTPGSTYGNPPANPKNPSDCMPVMNPDGSGKYTFVCDSIGVYVFNVPVCEPGGSPCKPVPLTITVLDSAATALTTEPIANPDYGTTKVNTPVTIPVVANDKCQNGPACTLSTPTVVVPPLHGVFDPNNNTYTPNTGFVGNDTLQYAVCDNQTISKCDTTFVYIRVLPANAPNSTTAADDYAQTRFNTPVSGDAKTNDTDPERDLQNVTPQTTIAPGKGTLELNADGTFTFTPVSGFSGPVSFPYTTCDTVSAPNTACASATIYILVEPKDPGSGPLPVILTNFSGVADQCSAKINWASATELNVRSYELQYSINGVDFATVSTTRSRGNNSNYSETYQPVRSGDASYRLKITDNNGTVTYSKIVHLKTNCNSGNASVSVFPNPVSSNANIKTPSPSSLTGTTVILTDANGRIVKQKLLTDSMELLDMNGLPDGMYFLKFADGTVKKLLKRQGN